MYDPENLLGIYFTDVVLHVRNDLYTSLSIAVFFSSRTLD